MLKYQYLIGTTNAYQVSTNQPIGGIMTNSSISQTDKPIKPCIKCGSTDRYKTGDCKPCASLIKKAWAERNKESLKEKRKIYYENNKESIAKKNKEYNLENKEKRRIYDKQYREENAEYTTNRNKDYRENNKESLRIKKKEYAENNKEKISDKNRIWRESHKEYLSEYIKAWYKENPSLVKTYSHNRRDLLIAGGKLSRDLFDKLIILQQGKCACCKVKLSTVVVHLDHIYPLARGGSNTDENIQLLCQRCNNRKHAKDPIKFMQENGYLL